MKYIVKFLMAAFFVSTAASCTEDMKYEPGVVTQVKQLLAPANNYYLELQSKATANMRFAWTPAMADDGVKAQYEVVFMKSAGGEILARYSGGMDASVNIPHKELNKIAGAVGVDLGTTGDIYWSVVSMNRPGGSTAVAAAPRCLTIKRLNGFNEIPATLFITGEATESGVEMADAMQFQETGAEGGEFIAFTRLEAGKTYEFVENTSGEGRRFSIEEGELREFNVDVKPASEPVTADKSGIFRIYLDFNTRATIIEQVTDLVFYQRDGIDAAAKLTYQGKGVWLLDKHTTTAGDGRYGFCATIVGESTYREKWSSVNYDNSSSPTAGSPADWWKIYMNKNITADGWWGYTFKWIDDQWAKSKVVTIEMHMDHTRDYYYHTVNYN